METEVAFVVDHVNVAELPAVIVVGEAERVAVGAGVKVDEPKIPQPDMSPIQAQVAMTDKHFMDKRIFHHP
jgi:hypothetical protein